MMKLIEYLATRCPYCNSDNHHIYGTRRHGIVTVRYHLCSCGKQFKSEETETRRGRDQVSTGRKAL